MTQYSVGDVDNTWLGIGVLILPKVGRWDLGHGSVDCTLYFQTKMGKMFLYGSEMMDRFILIFQQSVYPKFKYTVVTVIDCCSIKIYLN